MTTTAAPIVNETDIDKIDPEKEYTVQWECLGCKTQRTNKRFYCYPCAKWSVPDRFVNVSTCAQHWEYYSTYSRLPCPKCKAAVAAVLPGTNVLRRYKSTALTPGEYYHQLNTRV